MAGSGHQLLLERRPSGRRYLGLHLLLFAAGGVLIAAGLLAWLTAVPAVALIAAGILLPLAGLVYAWLATRATIYRLFPTTLEIQTGIVTRHIKNLQLFRVRDIALDQGLLGRMLGVGDVVLASTDEDTPTLVVGGISAPMQLYEELRRLVAEQAEKRTVILEQDAPRKAGGQGGDRAGLAGGD